ncbi:malate synthase A [Evansella clarkii]|uniref:malate synthase A n=1 Tax=Evansella clarkii TaxID=79879 RepID=UPI000B43904E|nr:malate synthase A [Evansella clarkii]
MKLTKKFSVQGPVSEAAERILTEEACCFIQCLHEKFETKRQELLQKRKVKQELIDQGTLPHFSGDTEHIRKGDWKVKPVPDDIQDRRVEITGPAGSRKMVINALNSGAKVFMADFEDANSPSWENCINGQLNMYDAVRRQIDYKAENGKEYKLTDKPAVLFVRPRGWHLTEKHFLVNGEPVSASLFDFGLYFFHNANELVYRGTAPYFYLPKMEYHEEAALWNEVFLFAQKRYGFPKGTIKATVLIETLTGAFEADEILHELQDHSAGLNCGRWDYIFSYIKKLRNHENFLLPDRSKVTMTVNFMRAYSLYVIKTCHKRGAHAIGGMAAQIPVKNDEEKNRQAIKKVQEDKEREVKDGHDGTWVAHPALVPTALDVFNEFMPAKNQLSKQLDDVEITAEDLLAVSEGEITEEGLRSNISVGIQYVEAWLRGHGAVPINNLMEDAATAEISRTQVWQWIFHREGILNDGRNISLELVETFIEEEMEKLKSQLGEGLFSKGKFAQAEKLFYEMVSKQEFEEFLTINAYEFLLTKKELV